MVAGHIGGNARFFYANAIDCKSDNGGQVLFVTKTQCVFCQDGASLGSPQDLTLYGRGPEAPRGLPRPFTKRQGQLEGDQNARIDVFAGVLTVCDQEGIIVEMDERAELVF